MVIRFHNRDLTDIFQAMVSSVFIRVLSITDPIQYPIYPISTTVYNLFSQKSFMSDLLM